MRLRNCPLVPMVFASALVAFGFLLLPTCTPTFAQTSQSTVIGVTLFLHGIGKAGDNANPSGLGNTTPLHPQRQVTYEVYNGRSELLMLQTSNAVYDAVSGSFKGRVDLGPNFPTGTYILKAKTQKYLRKQLGEQITLTTNTINEQPPAAFIVGDITNDNRMNILDYNVLMRCYNASTQRRLCTSQMELSADLNDDGKVDGVDYNLFLREIWAYKGQ